MNATNSKLKTNNSLKLKKLIAAFSFVALLLFSWLFTKTHPMWEFCDKHFFFWVNSFIRTSSFWQNFWAIASHSVLDWVHDLVMILFFLTYVFKKDEKTRLYKFAEVLFFSIIVAVSILYINRYLLTDIIAVNRKSPSLIYDATTYLSEKVRWLKVKDRSSESYPGDHATQAIFFILIIFHLKGWKSGLKALVYSFYWQLPRLVTGSHWLTDILMGSLTIATLVMSICIYTPFKKGCVAVIHFLLSKLRPEKKADAELEES